MNTPNISTIMKLTKLYPLGKKMYSVNEYTNSNLMLV